MFLRFFGVVWKNVLDVFILLDVKKKEKRIGGNCFFYIFKKYFVEEVECLLLFVV